MAEYNILFVCVQHFLWAIQLFQFLATSDSAVVNMEGRAQMPLQQADFIPLQAPIRALYHDSFVCVCVRVCERVCDISILLSTMAILTQIATRSVERFPFVHILDSTFKNVFLFCLKFTYLFTLLIQEHSGLSHHVLPPLCILHPSYTLYFYSNFKQ